MNLFRKVSATVVFGFGVVCFIPGFVLSEVATWLMTKSIDIAPGD